MKENLDKLIDATKKYLEVRIELIKLDIKDETGKYLLRFSFLMMGILLLGSAGLFFSLGLAYYFNRSFQSSFAGFFILAGFFMVLLILLFLLKKGKSAESFLKKMLDYFIFR